MKRKIKNLTKLKQMWKLGKWQMLSKRPKKKQRASWVLENQFLDIGTLEV